ncbi:hypothetical protein F4677DRAFT_433364 [Hypoxylon crocopeplum]|nr:hypothetical protein F4677DRAFT_433364 [Hypoxylon crocopeplum]
MGENPISSWTKFNVSTSKDIEVSIFNPLLTRKADYHKAFYGQIAESPGECILIVAWKTSQAYHAFTKSPEYKELLASVKTPSTAEPETQLIDFGKIAFWWRFRGFGRKNRIQIRTVYFPSTISQQTRETVKGLKGLVLTVAYGIDGRSAHLCPYDGVPVCGWIDNSQNWNGQQASACVWCHYWKSEEAEEKFKTTERRFPADGEDYKPLALEAFEQDLKSSGALGWKDYHIYFEEVPKVV